MCNEYYEKEAVITAIWEYFRACNTREKAELVVKNLPITTIKINSCIGCKHEGKYENEVEYGYPSPCTQCCRRSKDYYEAK